MRYPIDLQQDLLEMVLINNVLRERINKNLTILSMLLACEPLAFFLSTTLVSQLHLSSIIELSEYQYFQFTSKLKIFVGELIH
jgi:hypothetical protein